MSFARDLYSLLDSLGAQFPAGIPKQLIDSASRKARASAEVSAEVSVEVTAGASIGARPGSSSEQGSALFSHSGSLTSGIAFVGSWRANSDADIFSGAEGALLRGAIEKGLRLRCEEVLVLKLSASAISGVESARLTSGIRQELLADAAPLRRGTEGATALVVLGGNDEKFFSSADREALQKENLDVIILATHSLGAVLQDEQKKRAFWNDLKTASARRR